MFETQGGHAESSPRPSEEGVSFYHVLRPLDPKVPVFEPHGDHAEPGTFRRTFRRTGVYLPAPSAPSLASLHLADWSSIKSWLVCMQPGCVYTPELLPVSDPVLHLSTPML